MEAPGQAKQMYVSLSLWRCIPAQSLLSFSRVNTCGNASCHYWCCLCLCVNFLLIAVLCIFCRTVNRHHSLAEENIEANFGSKNLLPVCVPMFCLGLLLFVPNLPK